MDQLRAMKVFAAVADAGSLSAAARELGEPLTNISRQLSQLERHLDCTLLDRTTRRMALTDAGSAYLITCKQVLETLQNARANIAGQAADLLGELTLTAPAQFGHIHVLPVLAEFLARYPRISARMLLVDRVVDLLEEDIDIAVRIGELPDSTTLARHVSNLQLVTCASPAYLKRCGTPAKPADLTQHDCVTFITLPGGPRWIFKSRRYGRKSVRVRSRLAVNTADAAVAAAIAGVGVTRVLSYQAHQALQDGRLMPVLQRFDDTPIPVHLVYRRARAHNPRVQAFIQLAVERMSRPTPRPRS
ncbi:Transcriptional regulator, LysR family [Hyphomicrobium sulfonivorans]|uniref:Transcriptional regulator, LysR family n=1 Tax=Hyphomicrobium sulfonivorans TaxID=121290 RepID=A0A109BIM7_HYPSL|nr:LysR family transcriptional regulator [Hyphomicrobium sulfonivorans]KWT69513.1 Transcriptional regulator, LysR family [Hyphomicrobium sulfonivorans]